MSDRVWANYGSKYSPSSTAMNVNELPGGIYKIRTPPMQGWYLDRVQPGFVFNYKIYGNHSHILNRVNTAWEHLDSNVGILLNGIKGTGKTVTAQLIANSLVNKGVPVILVEGYTPILGEVLKRIEAPCAVLFDEFEKTHNSEQQQQLLSVMDGMSKNGHKRLYVFTTNRPNIDENFIDRPSRIRYHWEFNNLSRTDIREIVVDTIDSDLHHLIDSTVDYIASRRVCTIDSVKCTVQEVNVFRENPMNFNGVLNLQGRPPSHYLVQALSGAGEVFSLVKKFTPVGKMTCRVVANAAKSDTYNTWDYDFGRADSTTVRDSKYSFSLRKPSADNREYWWASINRPLNEQPYMRKFIESGWNFTGGCIEDHNLTDQQVLAVQEIIQTYLDKHHPQDTATSSKYVYRSGNLVDKIIDYLADEEVNVSMYQLKFIPEFNASEDMPAGAYNQGGF